MAGMLPGVGVTGRRRSTLTRQEDHPASGREYFRERTGSMAATSSGMDETALFARRRLEHKLGYLNSSSRTVKDDRQQSRDTGNVEKEGGKSSTRMLLGKTWNLGFNKLRKRSDGKVCAVCLDDFQGLEQQRVMDLSCSHKYHSECLLPWIADHPNCPCCRRPI